MDVIYLLLGLISLFFSQRILTRQITRLVKRFGGGHNAFIWFWSVIFLPGTIIHEVSHFLMAAITGTRTGRIEIFPEFIEDELKDGEARSVSLGSVQIARMNPIQGFLIGFSPLITGSALLVWLSTILVPTFQSKEYLNFSLAAYLFFTVANSFLPSKEDLKHTVPFLVLAILFFLGFWYLGFDLNISSNSKIFEIAKALGMAFFVSFAINSLIILLLLVAGRIFKKNP